MLVMFIWNKVPIATTSIIGVLAFIIFVPEITFAAAFRGFGSDMLFLIIGMVVVGNALFETGAAGYLGELIMRHVGTNEKVFIVVIILVSVTISLFMSNTAAAALMLPIVAACVGSSGGKLSKKNSFMMVAIAVCVGGGITVVSSPPQIIAQGFLEAGGHQPMSFFEIGWFGIPLTVLLILFYLTIGMKLQKKVFTFPEVEEEAPKRVMAPVLVERNYLKMLIAVSILLFCVVGFITVDHHPLTMGTIALLGATACVVTRCIPERRVFERMDWTTVVIMGTSFGIATALELSGAGEMVANGFIGLLGDNINQFMFLGALSFVCIVLTNFMSSTAAASILIPIGAFAAIGAGLDVRPAVMIVAVSTNIGYATPISTPPMTMALRGGYRFMDYVKVGGLFNLLAFGLVLLLIPLVFGV